MLRRAPTGPAQRAQGTLEEHDGGERADVAVGDALAFPRKVVRRTLEVGRDSLDTFKVCVTHEQRPISQIVFSVVPQARGDLPLDVKTLKRGTALRRRARSRACLGLLNTRPALPSLSPAINTHSHRYLQSFTLGGMSVRAFNCCSSAQSRYGRSVGYPVGGREVHLLDFVRADTRREVQRLPSLGVV